MARFGPIQIVHLHISGDFDPQWLWVSLPPLRSSILVHVHPGDNRVAIWMGDIRVAGGAAEIEIEEEEE